MMGSQTLQLNSDKNKALARSWVEKSPAETFVRFSRNKRTTDQNSKLWVLLSEISRVQMWHGQYLSAEDWKLIFMAGLNQELRIVPNLENNGFVSLGRSSSKLSRQEFSDLLELIHMFAAENEIDLGEPQKENAA